jgi:putative ABC transport system permease protein
VFVVEIPPGKNPDDAKSLPVRAGRIGLTAVIVDPKDHFGAQILRNAFGGARTRQVAWPQDVIPKFLQQIGNARRCADDHRLARAAGGGVSITVAIYNTMNERRREIAIMRSLGARRLQILTIIVGEAALLSFFGAMLGVVVCHVVAYLLRVVEDRTGRLPRLAAVQSVGAVACWSA